MRPPCSSRLSLLIGGILAAFRQIFHLSSCPNLPGHLSSARLKLPDNIVLLPLPPYAPELNPVEKIWEYMRQNWFGHQVWPSYKAIVDACCEAWNKLMQMPERIASITQRSWAAITVIE